MNGFETGTDYRDYFDRMDDESRAALRSPERVKDYLRWRMEQGFDDARPDSPQMIMGFNALTRPETFRGPLIAEDTRRSRAAMEAMGQEPVNSATIPGVGTAFMTRPKPPAATAGGAGPAQRGASPAQRGAGPAQRATGERDVFQDYEQRTRENALAMGLRVSGTPREAMEGSLDWQTARAGNAGIPLAGRRTARETIDRIIGQNEMQQQRQQTMARMAMEAERNRPRPPAPMSVKPEEGLFDPATGKWVREPVAPPPPVDAPQTQAKPDFSHIREVGGRLVDLRTNKPVYEPNQALADNAPDIVRTREGFVGYKRRDNSGYDFRPREMTQVGIDFEALPLLAPTHTPAAPAGDVPPVSGARKTKAGKWVKLRPGGNPQNKADWEEV